jgi:hypothetical protein
LGRHIDHYSYFGNAHKLFNTNLLCITWCYDNNSDHLFLPVIST